MIYLDSCLVIYAIEPNGAATDRVRDRLAQLDDTVAVSPLVIMECLVGPMRIGDEGLRQTYEAFFDSVHVVPLTTDVLVSAAELRASTGLRTPDSIHLAAARVGGCEALWTNDRRLAGLAGDFAVAILGEREPL